MRGQLVDVGGYRLHLYCLGEGSPTIVLDSGFADTSEQWRFVQPEIAKLTRVCSYDRAGLGWSDPGPLPRTSQRMSDELRAALTNAGIRGPYLLVGHSFAGLNMRLFAAQHPEEVAGVILVDSVHPGHYGEFPRAESEKLLFALLPRVAPFGVARWLGHCPAGPPACRQFTQVFDAMRESRGESAREVRVYAPTLGSTPLTVISHDAEFYVALDPRPERRLREDASLRWQHDLTQISSNSDFVMAKGTGHQIPTDRPELVREAIRKMLDAIRNPGAKRQASSPIASELPNGASGESFADDEAGPFGH